MSWNRKPGAAALMLVSILCPLLALLPACGNGGDKIALENHTGAGEAPHGDSGGIPVSQQKRSAEVLAAPETVTVNAVGSFQGWQEVLVSSEVDGRIAEVPVEIGQRVKKGDLLARLEETDFRLDVERAEAALDMAKADEENAENEFQRKKQLYEDNTIPKSSFDSYATRLAQAEANRRMAEAVLAQARHRLTKTRITAPVDSYVNEKIVSEGEFLSMATGYEMFRLVVDRPMKLVFEVPETLAVRIVTGEPVQATVAAFGDRVFEGTIHAVSPTASVATRTVPVEAKFANRNGELKSGFFASVNLSLPRGEALLLVPRDALRRDEMGESYVDTLDGDETRKAYVTVRGSESGRYLVDGDLQAGDTVLYF